MLKTQTGEMEYIFPIVVPILKGYHKEDIKKTRYTTTKIKLRVLVLQI